MRAATAIYVMLATLTLAEANIPHPIHWEATGLSVRKPEPDTPPALDRSPARLEFLMRDAERVQCLVGLRTALHTVLRPMLTGPGPIALEGVPLHHNLGDSLLWLGTIRVISTFGRGISHICAAASQSAGWTDDEFTFCESSKVVEAVEPGGVLLLSAGGNWGDLYANLQPDRLRNLTSWAPAFQSGRIQHVVQLPQSIHYRFPTRAAADAAIIESLPKGMFTLLTRQADNVAEAKKLYPSTQVLASPDIAFGIGPVFTDIRPEVDIFFLLRADQEGAASEKNVAWPDIVRRLDEHNITHQHGEWKYLEVEKYRRKGFPPEQLGERRLLAAVARIATGKVVVTNRLHASITANLVGRPLIWIDNTTKKLSQTRTLSWSFNSHCSEASVHSERVSNLAEAVTAAIALLQKPGFHYSTADQ